MKSISELIRLDNKSAIVTGAGQGIGQAIAWRLAEAGAAVLVADLNEDEAKATADAICDEGWRATAVMADVADKEDVEHMVLSCINTFGNLDILVNNAGIFPQVPIANMDPDQFQKVIDVNLRGVFLATKFATAHMKTKGGGNIINITSVDALHPSMVGLAHYDASKHGVWGFTKSAALEFAPDNIRINAIAPGAVATPGARAALDPTSLPEGVDVDAMMEGFLAAIPMHRMADPDEIARAALFLASELSSYMTGSHVVVDGGMLLT